MEQVVTGFANPFIVPVGALGPSNFFIHPFRNLVDFTAFVASLHDYSEIDARFERELALHRPLTQNAVEGQLTSFFRELLEGNELRSAVRIRQRAARLPGLFDLPDVFVRYLYRVFISANPEARTFTQTNFRLAMIQALNNVRRAAIAVRDRLDDRRNQKRREYNQNRTN